MRIGVLALQGAVSEHRPLLARCGVTAVAVRTVRQLRDLDGLVLPGGESTTLRKLLRSAGLWGVLAATDLPLLGTCAGAILLGRGADADATLGRMALDVTRNAYGRQRESFQAAVTLADDPRPFPGVFIRAPALTACGDGCRPVAWCGGEVVGAAQGHHLALAFHPELGDDPRLHARWLDSFK